MKNITRKIVALLASAVTTVTTLSANYSEVFAETTQETAVSSADSDYEVKKGDLFGSLNYETNEKSVSIQNEEANPDFTIYKVDHDRKMSFVGVSYHAKEDCILFVGVYNDEGTQLYSSVTIDLSAEDDYAELTIYDVMPEHYLIKTFMVGKIFNNPLSKPSYYNKETLAMQTILSKTTEDFNDDVVVNLDEDNSNNFIVLQDNVIEINTPNIYESKDDYGRFILKKCDDISSLKSGDKVVVYAEEDIVAFIVDKIESSEDKILITPVENADVGDIFKFIKIDSSDIEEKETTISKDQQAEPKKAPDIWPSVNLESPQCLDIERAELPHFKTEFEFEFTKKDGSLKETKIDTDKGLYLKLTLEFDVEVYYDFWNLYFGLEGSATASLSIQGEIEADIPILGDNRKTHSAFSSADFPIVGNKIIGISIAPKIFFMANGSVSLSYSRDYFFSCYTNTGFDLTSKDPNIVKLEASIEVGIRFELNIKILVITFTVFTLKPYAELKVGISTGISSANSSYKKHDCGICVEIDMQFVLGASIEVLVDKWCWTIAEITFNLGKCYWSSDIGWGKGECPNRFHQICVTIKDKKTKKPLSGVKLFEGYQVSEKNLVKLDNGQANVSDSDGKIKYWVNDSILSEKTYSVTAETENNEIGRCVIGKHFDDKSRKLQNFDLYIKTNSSSGGKDSDEEDEPDIDSDSDEDAGSFWPIIGNCGKRRTDVSDDITIYDDVYYAYYEDGECHIFGDGLVEGERMKYELNEYGIDSIKKLVICDGVKMCDVESNGSIINGWFNYLPIEEIEFMGDNGEIISDNFTPASCNSLTTLTLTDFETIDDNAFDGCINLTDITFPKSLRKIDFGAFRWCESLSNVTLNEGLEIIRGSAFEKTGIKCISIPKSVKILEHQSIESCPNLKTVILNGDIDNESGQPFCYSPVETLIMNDGVTKIGDMFFSNTNPQLRNVRFSNNLKSIGMDAFWGTAIEVANFPESLKGIDKDAFRHSALKKVNFSTGLTFIGDGAFKETKLESVKIPGNVGYIGNGAFAEDPITDLELSVGVAHIGEHAFENTLLSSVTIPRSVTFIGYSAFNSDTLKEITILNSECPLKNSIVPKTVTIYGYKGSSAEAYAKTYGNPFKALDAPAVTTTTKATTTTATTTTAAVVTTQVAPDSECVFIAVKDTAGASSDKVFADGNVKYFDQQTADANGVVSFSYLPDEKEKWAFIFVSQVINDTITKTFGTADDLKTTTYNVAPGVKGDANGDGEIDMSDVVLIMQALANPNKYGIEGTDPKHISENGFKYADSDGDGLTVNDALRIQQYLLGIIPALT